MKTLLDKIECRMGSFSLQNEVLGVLNNVVQEVEFKKIFFLELLLVILFSSRVLKLHPLLSFGRPKKGA